MPRATQGRMQTTGGPTETPPASSSSPHAPFIQPHTVGTSPGPACMSSAIAGPAWTHPTTHRGYQPRTSLVNILPGHCPNLTGTCRHVPPTGLRRGPHKSSGSLRLSSTCKARPGSLLLPTGEAITGVPGESPGEPPMMDGVSDSSTCHDKAAAPKHPPPCSHQHRDGNKGIPRAVINSHVYV